MKLEIVWIALKFIALIFTSFELFSIITNKNKKMSIAGTLVLAFSGCVIWNLDKFDSLILGGLITVLINKIIEEKSYKKIIPMILIIIVSSVIYMYTFRPFAISFGYVFLALITWLILNNIKELKGNKSKIITICLAIGLSIIAAICAEIFGKNVYSDYIESNTSAGISGIFTYLYTPLLGIKNVSHSDIWAGIVSAFPIPAATVSAAQAPLPLPVILPPALPAELVSSSSRICLPQMLLLPMLPVTVFASTQAISA